MIIGATSVGCVAGAAVAAGATMPTAERVTPAKAMPKRANFI
nr:hypothetical protein [Kibdelosporangium sp. MJ126-NF4]